MIKIGTLNHRGVNERKTYLAGSSYEIRRAQKRTYVQLRLSYI